MIELLKRLVADDRGPSAVEYGLIAALVSVVIIGALIVVGGNLKAVFDAIGAALAL